MLEVHALNAAFLRPLRTGHANSMGGKAAANDLLLLAHDLIRVGRGSRILPGSGRRLSKCRLGDDGADQQSGDNWKNKVAHSNRLQKGPAEVAVGRVIHAMRSD
jgi:hypothetical protein